MSEEDYMEEELYVEQLQQELSSCKKENINLRAKTTYYKSIITRLVNDEELSTGQMNTVASFIKVDNKKSD